MAVTAAVSTAVIAAAGTGAAIENGRQAQRESEAANDRFNQQEQKIETAQKNAQDQQQQQEAQVAMRNQALQRSRALKFSTPSTAQPGTLLGGPAPTNLANKTLLGQ